MVCGTTARHTSCPHRGRGIAGTFNAEMTMADDLSGKATHLGGKIKLTRTTMMKIQ